MSSNATFLNKLQYLLSVGYDQNIINSFKDYCLDEEYDEEGTIDDFDDVKDSSIIEHLENIYNWNDQQRNDFFAKSRQALDIDSVNDTQQIKPYLYQRTNCYITHRKKQIIQITLMTMKLNMRE